MRYYNDDIKLDNERTAIALGKFDGIHKGHEVLLKDIISYGRNLSSCIFTFDRSPNAFLSDKEDGFILTRDERKKKLNDMGVDILVEYPFTKEFAGLMPEDFVKNILVEKLHMEVMTVGADFCFGRKRSGNVSLLKELSERYNFTLNVYDKLSINDVIVSSSLIRECLLKGDMDMVRLYLGEEYKITGKVVSGARLGRTIGHPTANLLIDPTKILPPFGVYASRIKIDDNIYSGVSNLGIKPTVSDEGRVGLETYIFDFDNDIYSKDIEVSLHGFLRHEMKFDNIDLLKEQLEKDVQKARDML